MAARNLPAELNQIYPDVVENVDELQPFLDSAHLLVQEEISSVGHSEGRMKLIELYLAAHLAVITLEKGGLVKQRIDDAEETYQVPGFNTVGLVTTRFGQQVVILDTSGKMAALSQKPVKAAFRVYGDDSIC